MLWATSLRCQLKYLRKKCVFNLRLKADEAFKLHRSVGKLFHNLGAVTPKARSPTSLRAMGWYSLMALSKRRRLSTLTFTVSLAIHTNPSLFLSINSALLYPHYMLLLVLPWLLESTDCWNRAQITSKVCKRGFPLFLLRSRTSIITSIITISCTVSWPPLEVIVFSTVIAIV